MVTAQMQLPGPSSQIKATATPLPPDPTTGEGIAQLRAGEVPGSAPEAGPDDGSTFSYYFVLGHQLLPWASDTIVAYGGNGCRSVTRATDIRSSFPVNIPDGSAIKYLRIYYVDTSPSYNMQAFLTTYPNLGQSSSRDVLSVILRAALGLGRP